MSRRRLLCAHIQYHCRIFRCGTVGVRSLHMSQTSKHQPCKAWRVWPHLQKQWRARVSRHALFFSWLTQQNPTMPFHVLIFLWSAVVNLQLVKQRWTDSAELPKWADATLLVWREPFGAFFSWLGHLIGFEFDVSVVPLLTSCLSKFGSLSCFKWNKNGLQCQIFMDFCLSDNGGVSLGHSIGVKIAAIYLFLLSFAKPFPLGRQQPQNIVFQACIVHRFTMN